MQTQGLDRMSTPSLAFSYHCAPSLPQASQPPCLDIPLHSPLAQGAGYLAGVLHIWEITCLASILCALASMVPDKLIQAHS